MRPAWRIARRRNLLGCGGQIGDLEVELLYTLSKGKCQLNGKGGTWAQLVDASQLARMASQARHHAKAVPGYSLHILDTQTVLGQSPNSLARAS